MGISCFSFPGSSESIWFCLFNNTCISLARIGEFVSPIHSHDSISSWSSPRNNKLSILLKYWRILFRDFLALPHPRSTFGASVWHPEQTIRLASWSFPETMSIYWCLRGRSASSLVTIHTYKGPVFSLRTHQSGLPAKNPKKLARSQSSVCDH